MATDNIDDKDSALIALERNICNLFTKIYRLERSGVKKDTLEYNGYKQKLSECLDYEEKLVNELFNDVGDVEVIKHEIDKALGLNMASSAIIIVESEENYESIARYRLYNIISKKHRELVHQKNNPDLSFLSDMEYFTLDDVNNIVIYLLEQEKNKKLLWEKYCLMMELPDFAKIAVLNDFTNFSAPVLKNQSLHYFYPNYATTEAVDVFVLQNIQDILLNIIQKEKADKINIQDNFLMLEMYYLRAYLVLLSPNNRKLVMDGIQSKVYKYYNKESDKEFFGVLKKVIHEVPEDMKCIKTITLSH